MKNIALAPPKVKIKLPCASCGREIEVHLSVSGPHFKAECTQCGRFVRFVGKKDIERLQRVETYQRGCPPDRRMDMGTITKIKPQRKSILPPLKGK